MIQLKPGDWVKIAIDGERFWVKIVVILSDNMLEGVVDNDLLETEKHGLRLGSKLILERSIIIDVMAGSGEPN